MINCSGFPIKNRLESGFSDFGSGLKPKNCSGFRASGSGFGLDQGRNPNNCSSWTAVVLHISAPFSQPCHAEQLFEMQDVVQESAVELSGFGLRVLTHLVVRGMTITICGHET